MNAVISAPRAKAQPAHTIPPSPYVPGIQRDAAEHFCDVQVAIDDATDKLKLAYEAAECGDPVDTILDLIAHRLLTEAVSPIMSGSPSRAEGEATYEALFGVLGALHGAIALAVGTVVHATLIEAYHLLDWAQNELDSATLANLLPEVETAAPESESEAAAQATQSTGANFVLIAYTKASEAGEILDYLLQDLNSGVAYGAFALIKIAIEALSGAHEAPTKENANHASAELSVAIDVLELFTVSEQVLGSKLLAAEGVLSLLNLAKSILDDGIGSLP